MKIVSVRFLLILLVYQSDSYKIVGVSVSVRILFFFKTGISPSQKTKCISPKSGYNTNIYIYILIYTIKSDNYIK